MREQGNWDVTLWADSCTAVRMQGVITSPVPGSGRGELGSRSWRNWEAELVYDNKHEGGKHALTVPAGLSCHV